MLNRGKSKNCVLVLKPLHQQYMNFYFIKSYLVDFIFEKKPN